MNTNIEKEAIIEYCENLIGLVYSNINSDVEKKEFLDEIKFYEKEARLSNDSKKLNSYKVLLNKITNRIEEKTR